MAQNTATLSPSTAAPPGRFIAKHLGKTPEDVEEWQIQSMRRGFQVRGMVIYTKELTCSLNWPLVSQYHKPRQTSKSFVTASEITALDNPFTCFCLNMIMYWSYHFQLDHLFLYQQESDTMRERSANSVLTITACRQLSLPAKNWGSMKYLLKLCTEMTWAGT